MPTLFHNAIIHTLTNENDCYSAMLVMRGRVAKLYKETPDNIKGAKKIDCKGRVIIPSFSDAHMHFLFSAFVMGIGLNISEITAEGIVPKDLQGVRQKIADYIKDNKTNDVLCFNYMTASILEERLPTRQEMESWFPNVNISVITLDSHSSSHTTKLLKYMGMYKEGCDGILSGEDHEFNTGPLFNYFKKKKMSFAGMIRAIRKFNDILISYGVTDITCLEAADDQSSNMPFNMIKLAKRLSRITYRTSPQLSQKKRVKKLVGRDKHPLVGGCGTWELDGAIGSKTAAFDMPYLGTKDECGKVYYSVDEAQNMIQTFYDDGYQTMIHAIGTQAIDTAVKAYQNVLGNKSANKQRCRIEHFEFPLAEHMQAVRNMNLLISVQPGYSWMDHTYQHSYEKWIDKKLIDREVPLKKLYDMGVKLLGSSDSPVQMPNPFIQIQGMVNYHIAEHSLSVYEALRTYTYNNAYANFTEQDKGTLEIGKQADFVVLHSNPFEVDKRELVDIKVHSTYIKGKLIK